MKVRHWIGSSLLLLGLFCLTVTGHGQGKDKLEWTAFEKEKSSFYQTVKTETLQELKVLDMTLKQKQEQTFLMKWTSKGKKDGKLVLTQEILGVEMDMDIGGNKISYKTGKDTAKNPMTQFFKALEEAKFEITVDTSTGKVTKVDGLKELVEKLTKVNKSFESALKVILSEETGKTMAEPIFAMIPKDGKIPPSNKWSSEKVVLGMGALGKYTTTNDYTSEGEDKDNKNLIKIKVEPKVSYEPPAESKKDDPSGLPFKIKGGKLNSQKSSGTIYFNKDKGRLESSKLHVEVTGDLDVSIGSTNATVGLNQTQDTTVNSYDEDPWKKGK